RFKPPITKGGRPCIIVTSRPGAAQVVTARERGPPTEGRHRCDRPPKCETPALSMPMLIPRHTINEAAYIVAYTLCEGVQYEINWNQRVQGRLNRIRKTGRSRDRHVRYYSPGPD